jgi:hypothetical protein
VSGKGFAELRRAGVEVVTGMAPRRRTPNQMSDRDA